MTAPILRALSGEVLPVPPCWFMRQAGRFLPEYRAIREKASFEQLLYDPALAAEVTLQPVRRFAQLDGAIIFSDILIVLEALGCGVTIPEGGPVLARTLDQIEPTTPLNQRIFEPIQGALRIVRAELPKPVALLGFAGAPWTLLAYGIEGKGSKTWAKAKAFLHQEPVKARAWLDRLADAAAYLLNLQIAAGAQAVQLFDTWAGELDPEDYATFALPAVERVFAQVKGVPRLFFARTANMPKSLASLPCEGLAVPWQVEMAQARARFSPAKVLQGNLDPAALLAGADVACRKSRAIVEAMRGAPHVFNLGHGILPGTDPDVLAAVMEAVKGGPR